MFDRKGFAEYVGGTSGNSYASGLASIESIYNVDIDSEYEKDQCGVLLSKIESDKKRKDLSDNDLHYRRNYFSHLKKYVEYRSNVVVIKQRKDFVIWMQKQPRRDNTDKRYSDETINAAAGKLQSGLKTLGIRKYTDINCFSLVDSARFAELYKDCYATAEALDKKQGHRDFRNGLEFYMQFLNEQNGTSVMPVNPVIEKLRFIINKYKANFTSVDKAERYKWIAVAWYKQHWNIDAPNFGEMVATAFEKADNLLASGMYYAYKMLTEYANAKPEKVRALFRTLHNEELPLSQRYDEFRNGFGEYINALKTQTGKDYNHYQDLHAISVYLFFEYPEKYFIYKSTMYTKMRDRIGFVEEKTKQKAVVGKFESYAQMCELILTEINSDEELQSMSQSRLDSSCYKDDAFHLLAMDIAFYGGVYMDDADFGSSAEATNDNVYWPSLEEYNPRISKEMWLEILRDPAITTAETLAMLKMILELGGESTCAHLADVYGNTFGYYNRLGSAFGKRIKDKYNCPDCIDKESDTTDRNRVYVIPFVGRNVKENGNQRYSWKLRDELKEAMESMDLNNIVTEESVTDVELNTILYGPPGTGKTYHSAIYAVAIIENKKLTDVAKEDYDEVLIRYNEYKTNGRIAFTTFHQAYGYEEFIEGIKPVVISDDDGEGKSDIQYAVSSGIFKDFCDKTVRKKNISQIADYGLNESPNVWKVSLEGTGDNPTRTECLSNNHIRIGWDAYGKDITDETDFSADGGKKPINAFINRMRVGDIVLSCYSATTIDAIGVITGEYEWHDEYSHYKRLRKVNWIVKNIKENIMDITGGTTMTLSSVYRFANVTLNDVLKIVEKYKVDEIASETSKDNYVFIIDEINRGNISKIFGELITLIEPSKRIGASEEMTAVLPYSSKPFGVPNNVYIIGTMNTADRSIATIDTALRRRFYFKEMLPDPDVLKDVYVEDLSISDLLTRINKRITVLYDREHTIGHSYFMALKTAPTIDTLAKIFENNIIPLLQEYFYEDYEKIRLVLGDNKKKDEETQFIVAKANDYAALFGNADVGLDDGYSYEINTKALDNIEAYRSI